MSAAFKVAVADAYRSVPTPDGKRFAQLFAHGTLAVEIYAPRATDPQKPHTRDEVYIIAQGSGDFVSQDAQKQDQRVHFAPGDLLFAAAGVPHRFENFADDFFTWVLFYGPEGGEARKPQAGEGKPPESKK
jgi:mannose-6-phosphate isomerase-like protein (cupin superfamily)